MNLKRISMKSLLGTGTVIGLSLLAVTSFQNCSPQKLKSGNLSSGSPVGQVTAQYMSSIASDGSASNSGASSNTGSAAPSPTDAIVLSVDGQITNGPFKARQGTFDYSEGDYLIGHINIEINGFAEDDTFVCIDNEYHLKGGPGYCDRLDSFKKLPENLRSIAKFKFKNGVWQGIMSTFDPYSNQRVIVKDSHGKIAVKEFVVGDDMYGKVNAARSFLNGKLNNLMAVPDQQTLEIRYYGMTENNTFFCRTENHAVSGPHNSSYPDWVELCPQDHFVKITSGQDGFIYKNGIWTKMVDTSRLVRDTATYGYILIDRTTNVKGECDVIASDLYKNPYFSAGPN